MRRFPGVPSCEKYGIQASPVPACWINEDLFACVRSAVFQISKCQVSEFLSAPVLYYTNLKDYTEEVAKGLLEGILEGKREIKKREEREKQEIKNFEERRLAREFELERLRAQLRSKLNENELKAGNRINNLANVCYLSENHTAKVSKPVSKCRSLINPVVNKSVEKATSCNFENENWDLPVRGTNVFPPSGVRGRGTEKYTIFKVEEGKELNVYRSSDCEVKVGVCEGSVKAVAMCAQQVINPDDIGGGSLELIGEKGGTNNEGLICENICEEKYTIGTLMGCEKQLTVNRESFRNHTMAEIAGQLNGGKNMCKADVEEDLGDGLAMRLPLSEPWEIYKDSLETDNRSNIG
ncbi:uncharacterized protein TNCV_1478211 [Trichonephila clavipes]|nr:uncharacterized protein TNCV_1478211 [Trichonephila clavipes]